MNFFCFLQIISKSTRVFTLSLKSHICWYCWVWIVKLIKQFWKFFTNRAKLQVFYQYILLLFFLMRQINDIFNVSEARRFNRAFDFVNRRSFHEFCHFLVLNYGWIIRRFHQFKNIKLDPRFWALTTLRQVFFWLLKFRLLLVFQKWKRLGIKVSWIQRLIWELVFLKIKLFYLTWIFDLWRNRHILMWFIFDRIP